jgi:drug/metabolite transporter (DMT)-like permease
VNLPLGIGLATSAAVSFATADFCGALVARRVTPLSAALSVQVVSGAALGVLLVVSATTVTPTAAAIGLLAGIAVALGISTLYQALAAGALGLVAIITGVVASSVTLGYDVLINGEPPSAIQLAGMAVAIAGAGFSAQVGTVSSRIATLCVVAGVSFGASFILYNRAAGENPVSVLFYARLSAIVLLGVAWLVMRPRQLTAHPLIAAAGLLDTAANALMLAAVSLMPVSLATAISSAEPPVIVMVLARAFVGEGLPRTAYLAVGLAAAGIGLMLLG